MTPEPPHDHRRYRRRLSDPWVCRCDICRAAHAERQRLDAARRRSGPIPPDVQHGTHSTYNNWGCRCRPCTDANTAFGRPYLRRYQIRQRALKRQQQP